LTGFRFRWYRPCRESDCPLTVRASSNHHHLYIHTNPFFVHPLRSVIKGRSRFVRQFDAFEIRHSDRQPAITSNLEVRTARIVRWRSRNWPRAEGRDSVYPDGPGSWLTCAPRIEAQHVVNRGKVTDTHVLGVGEGTSVYLR